MFASDRIIYYSTVVMLGVNKMLCLRISANFALLRREREKREKFLDLLQQRCWENLTTLDVIIEHHVKSSKCRKRKNFWGNLCECHSHQRESFLNQ